MGSIHPNPFTGQAPHRIVEELKREEKFSNLTNRLFIAKQNEAKRKAAGTPGDLTPAQKK